MKKRNVAVAMAAMTMATSVAPVVANAAGEETNLTLDQYAAFENQLKGYINTKYSEGKNKGKSVYKIVALGIGEDGSLGKDKSFTICDTSILENDALKNLEKVKKEIVDLPKGKSIRFEVQDLGHRVDEKGNILDTGNVKLTLSEISKYNKEYVKELLKGKEKDLLENLKSSGVEYYTEYYMNENNKEIYESMILLGENTVVDALLPYIDKVELKGNDLELLLNTPKLTESNDKNNKVKRLMAKVDEIDKKIIAKDKIIKLKIGDDSLDFANPIIEDYEIKGFEKLQGEIGASEADVTVISNSTSETYNLSKVDIDAKARELNDKYTFSNLNTAKDDIKEVNGVFEVTLFAKAIKVKSLVPDDTMAQVTLRSNTKADLEKMIDLLNGQLGDITSIIGTNRVDTAIKLSKENYNPNATKDGAVDNVVLVGENAIVDGLSAAPLAATKNAPVLLTNSKTLNPEVKEEIKRAMNLEAGISANTPKTVYIVGGEAVVSSEIELELANMGLTVKRLAGTDRSKTSLEVAEEVGITNKAFVVGGEGLADAMSIAPVAAREKSPIIVVNKEKLSDEVKTKLKSFGTADIIGGEGVVSEDVEKEIDDSVLGTSTRVEGNNRKETNAAVIKKYYNTNSVDKFYVAKDGSNAVAEKVNTELVDALAAAPIAGKNNAPIVLATNDVNTKQSIAISSVKSTKANKLVQVGGGIAEAVIDQVKDLLGL